jgi:hypothetical protein
MHIRKRRASARTTLLAGLLLGAAAAQAEAPVSPFVAEYEVAASIARGTLTLTLEERETAWVFTSTAQPTGLLRLFKRGSLDERAELRWTDGGVDPLIYLRDDDISGPEKDATLHFIDKSAESHRIQGNDRDKTLDLVADRETLDRLSMQLQLMYELKSDRRPTAFTVIDKGRQKEIEITYGQFETVTVGDREIEALRLVHRSKNSSRSTVLWCAPEWDYLPVRIEQTKDGETNYRARLVSLERSPTGGLVGTL